MVFAGKNVQAPIPQGKKRGWCLCHKVAPDLSRKFAEVITLPLEFGAF